MYIDGQYYHPTFLYESAWDVLGFIILINLRKHLKIGKRSLFILFGIQLADSSLKDCELIV